MFRFRSRSLVNLCASLIIFLAGNASAAPVTVPPSNLGNLQKNNISPVTSVPNLILPQNIKILKSIDLSRFSGNPQLNLNGAKLNISPLLSKNNTFNRNLQILKAKPNLVVLKDIDNKLVETDKGILISRALTFQPKPGVCSKKSKKFANKSLFCGKRSNLRKTLGLIADPASKRYIADTQLRRAAENNLNKTNQSIQQDAAQYRQGLNSPKAVQKLGQKEVNRLKALSDEDLTAELFEAGETTIEEGFFIPRLDKMVFTRTPLLVSPQISPQTLKNLQKFMQPEKTVMRSRTIDLGSETFLTGFTFGKNYEWKKRISKTINPCSIYWGTCRKTYYIEPYTKLGFGLGLRFPIRSNLKLDYPGSGDNAEVTATFNAFNGNARDYQATGIDSGQVFEGKELVAEYSYKAGVSWKLPNTRSRLEYGDAQDFTDNLPRPFTNGQFRPPSPGEPTPVLHKTFNNIDMLAGRADFGVGGAKLHPAVKINMESDNLTFNVIDLSNNSRRKISSGQSKQVKLDPATGEASFEFGKPQYNIAFTVNPGLKYNIFIDLVVWENNWTDTLWIPQVKLTLPPEGMDFSCHANTRCNKQYLVKVAEPGTFEAARTSKKGKTNTANKSGKSTTTSKTYKTGTDTKSSKNGGFFKTSKTAKTDKNKTAGSGTACQGNNLGVWSFSDPSTGVFVRGGVTTEGRNDVVATAGNNSPPQKLNDWGHFRLLQIPGGRSDERWLQSTIDGRFLQTDNRSNSLIMKQGSICNSNVEDMKWRLIKIDPKVSMYRIQNIRTGKFVRVTPERVLKADTNEAGSKAFYFRYFQGTDKPAAGTSTTASSTGNTSQTSPQSCDTSKNLGIWAMRAKSTGQYVRGGVSAEGRNDVVGAMSGKQKPRSRKAWEAFNLYRIPTGTSYDRWMVNTIDGRFLETVNKSGTLLLPKGRNCSAKNQDLQWRLVHLRGKGYEYYIQNLNTGKYVRLASNGLMKADGNAQQAEIFVFEKL